MRKLYPVPCTLYHGLFELRAFVPLCLCASLLLAFCARCFANDGYVGSIGQTAFPLQNSDIVMEREKVVMDDLGEDAKEARVECTFWFKNTTDKEVEIEMGFPEEEHNGGDVPEDYFKIRNFSAQLDGAPVEVFVKEGGENKNLPSYIKYRRWFTWKVKFAPGSSCVVKNTYTLHQGGNNMGGWFYSYVLKTGALWAGKVGRAEIIFKSKRFPYNAEDLMRAKYAKFLKEWMKEDAKKESPSYFAHLSPGNWAVKNGAVTWTFTDFEPKNDIEVGFSGEPEFVNMVIERFPKSDIAKRALLSRILGIPPAAWGNERLEAIKQYAKWFPKEKDSPNLWLGTALAYRQLGDDTDVDPERFYESAEQYFNKIIEAYPAWWNIHKVYADAGWFYLQSVKSGEDALNMFLKLQSVCATMDDCYYARYGKFLAYEQMKKWKEAKAACEDLMAWAKQNDKPAAWLQKTLDEINANLSSK